MTTGLSPLGSESLIDVADTIVGLVDRGLIREAEVGIAVIALWLLRRVEAGQTTREQADEIFTELDVRLSAHPAAAQLSTTSQDLVTEGEHFHHFGEEWGTNPEQLRALAYAILQPAAA